MKINLRGVRGSIPTPGPETEKYGGNTTCVDVSQDGWSLVLDGGTGLRKSDSGNSNSNKRIDILLTHLHLDHIQGLGFFKPFFNPDLDIHIWGPVSNVQTLYARLSRYLSPPLFPVLIRDLPCKLTLHEIENSEFEIGPFKIKSGYVIHPGPTVGYRISNGNSIFTFIPDHEPALGLHGLLNDPKWISGYDLAKEADILIHDAQYTSFEYSSKIGWGHSSMNDTLLYSSIAGTKKLFMTHHDPSHTDNDLDEILTELRTTNELPFSFEFAAENMEFILP